MKDLNALFGLAVSLGGLVDVALDSLYVFLLPTAIAAAPSIFVALPQRRKYGGVW